MHYTTFIFIAIAATMAGCTKDANPNPPPPPPEETGMYFPPNNSTDWETKSIASLGWNESALQPLKQYLSDKYSKSFMILVNGRIVMEEYFNGHTKDSLWHWHSAGKTLVAAITGIAQQEGLLNINDKVSKYLGKGWTSEPKEKRRPHNHKTFAYHDLRHQRYDFLGNQFQFNVPGRRGNKMGV